MRIITAWQCISPEVIVKGFKKSYTFNAVDDTNSDMLWNGSEEDGNARIERKMTALTVKMVIATLTGKGR
jgi:hypothetical protein